jgi:FkbM family methyltransferase
MKKIIDIIFVKMGFKILPFKKYREIKKFYKDFERRRILFHSQKIDFVIDVGANNGGYAKYLREQIGYTDQILSFEPLTKAYNELSKIAAKDAKWETLNLALGDENKMNEINISNNSHSSSILPMDKTHEIGDPTSKYIKKEKIETITLDSIFAQYCNTDGILLKIDTQGYEKFVLLGSLNSLDKIKMIQIEMSLVSLYKGSWLFDDIKIFLEKYGFVLVSLENGFYNNETGVLYQVDGIFIKK